MTVRVPPLPSPRRLDRVLKEGLPALSRNGLFAALRKGRVRVDGVRVREAGHLLTGGEEIRVEEVPGGGEADRGSSGTNRSAGRAVVRTGGPKRRLPLVVLHEDEHLIVIDKPADLSVHPGKESGFTLIEALRDHGRERGFEPFLVHRLDRGTSGVMIAAKSKAAATLLGRAFKERAEAFGGAARAERDRPRGDLPPSEVKKWYVALVWGDAPASGRLTEPLDGRRAESQFQLSGRFRWNRSPLSLVRVEILTGRKHQIRRHLAAAGFPVVGDELYGDFELNRLFRKERRAKGLFLHAAGLELTHPMTGVRLRFEAALPKEFEAILHGLYSPPASG